MWLTGQGGGRFLLGTLAPEGEGLRLRRNLSRTQLEMAGCWPVTGAESKLAFSFGQTGGWYCQSCPGQMLRDPVLKEQAPGSMLCRRGERAFSWLPRCARTAHAPSGAACLPGWSGWRGDPTLCGILHVMAP